MLKNDCQQKSLLDIPRIFVHRIHPHPTNFFEKKAWHIEVRTYINFHSNITGSLENTKKGFGGKGIP